MAASSRRSTRIRSPYPRDSGLWPATSQISATARPMPCASDQTHRPEHTVVVGEHHAEDEQRQRDRRKADCETPSPAAPAGLHLLAPPSMHGPLSSRGRLLDDEHRTTDGADGARSARTACALCPRSFTQRRRQSAPVDEQRQRFLTCKVLGGSERVGDRTCSASSSPSAASTRAAGSIGRPRSVSVPLTSEHQVLQPEVLAGGNRHMQHQRTTIPGSARDEARGRPSNRVAPRP